MYTYVKRVADAVAAAIVLVLLIIPGVIIALIIKLDSKGPVLFKTKRVGRNKEIFEIYKFRSMVTDAPILPPGKFASAEDYITRSGNILRKTSLDELPQLINVIKGDMSIVGPRPGAAKNEDELIVERDKYDVFSVRPGIGGWAQANGRDELALDVAQKAKVDGEYVEKFGLLMDIKCLYLTFATVITNKGYQEGGSPVSANGYTLTSDTAPQSNVATSSYASASTLQ